MSFERFVAVAPDCYHNYLNNRAYWLGMKHMAEGWIGQQAPDDEFLWRLQAVCAYQMRRIDGALDLPL